MVCMKMIELRTVRDRGDSKQNHVRIHQIFYTTEEHTLFLFTHPFNRKLLLLLLDSVTVFDMFSSVFT